MPEKQAFFNLDPATQNRVRSFTALLFITGMIEALIIPYTTILCPIVAIIFCLIFLYFSVFITRAPVLYFRMITWLFWFAIIGAIAGIIMLALNQEPFGIEYVLNLFRLALVVVFARSVMRFRRSIRETKREQRSSTAR